MYVFRGKFNFERYAVNEGITFVFPSGVGPNEEVHALWQWTVNEQGAAKGNVTYSGVVSHVDSTTGAITLFTHPDQYYNFSGTLSADLSSIDLTLHAVNGGKSEPFKVTLNHADPAPLVYTGKLNWLKYALNQMITFVVPSASHYNTGDSALLYWQWDEDAEGVKKGNVSLKGNIEVTEVGPNGVKKFVIATSYYSFQGTVSGDRKELKLTMSNPGGATSNTIDFVPQFLD